LLRGLPQKFITGLSNKTKLVVRVPEKEDYIILGLIGLYLLSRARTVKAERLPLKTAQKVEEVSEISREALKTIPEQSPEIYQQLDLEIEEVKRIAREEGVPEQVVLQALAQQTAQKLQAEGYQVVTPTPTQIVITYDKAILHVKVRAPFIAVPDQTMLYVYIDDLYYSVPKMSFPYSCGTDWCEESLTIDLDFKGFTERKVLIRYGYKTYAYGRYIDVPTGEAPLISASVEPDVFTVVTFGNVVVVRRKI
jgi:hypothetical protein